jgi:acetyltransferase-like isoleucine patch superfamily enzyme
MTRAGRALAAIGKLVPAVGLVANRLRHPGLHCGLQVEIVGPGRLIHGRGASIGATSRIYFDQGGSLELGDGVGLGRDTHVQTGGRVRIGARTGINDRARLYGDVAIGRGCAIGPNLFAASGEHLFRTSQPWLPLEMQVPDGEQPSRPVTIHDDCWIGINVVITPGITIGRGAVVGANAVVTRDVPPYEVWAGAPARRIGERMSFAPPAEIDSAAAEHMPYFYAGFEQVNTNGEGYACDRNVIVAVGGDPVGLELDVTGVTSGSLTYRGATISFEQGRNRISFARTESDDAALHAIEVDGTCAIVAARRIA